MGKLRKRRNPEKAKEPSNCNVGVTLVKKRGKDKELKRKSPKYNMLLGKFDKTDGASLRQNLPLKEHCALLEWASIKLPMTFIYWLGPNEKHGETGG